MTVPNILVNFHVAKIYVKIVLTSYVGNSSSVDIKNFKDVSGKNIKP
jgi:hypothetical protein